MIAKPVIAVIDTDVLYNSERRAVLVEAIQSEAFVGVWSPNVIAELFRLITRTWIAQNGFDRPSLERLSALSKRLLNLLLASLVLVDTGPRDDRNFPQLKDIDDLHLVAAGKLAQADFIVSNNARHFPPADSGGRHLYDRLEFITYDSDNFLRRLSIDEDSLLLRP